MKHTEFKKILFCTDFSHNAAFAFDYALSEAVKDPQSELIIFHVIPEPNAQFWKSYIYEIDKIDEKARNDIDKKIDEEYLHRIPEEQRFSVIIKIGREDHSIVDYAKEQDIDLIVIGRQGNSALRKIFFGNIAESVVRKAPCPVLIIPSSFEGHEHS